MKVSERYEVPTRLEGLVERVRKDEVDLTAPEMDKGRRIRDTVTEAVEDVVAGVAGFPRLLAGEEFTGGSFGRRTQAQPLDDVDLFFPLDAASLRMESPTNIATREVLVTHSDENPLGCMTPLQEGAWLASGKVLDHMEDLVGANIPLGVADLRRHSRGRCVHMTYDGINVDLVFVLMGHVRGAIDRYHLPSGDSRCWKATNPKEDQRQLSKENQSHDGLLLPTIRALKAWNDHWLGGRLKSIHLEVLASHYAFRQLEIDSVVAALTHAFHELPSLLDGPCPDPTGLGDPLDVNLHRDDRDWVQAEARKAARLAVSLNSLATTDPREAAQGWRNLLMTDRAEAPERDRTPRPPRHNGDFGQPAHHCDGYKGFGVPLVRTEDRPLRAPDQTGRSGEFG